MISIMAIFVFMALLILLGSHWFLYYSFIKFFSITVLNHRIILAVIFGILSISFIASTFLVRSYDNFITRAYYLFSGFWLGLALNLVIAAAIVWLIVGASQIFNFNASRIILGIIFFGAALAFSIYGIWNAFYPRIKNISVSIPNLPEEWKGKKIIQISDIHLGDIYQKNFMEKVIRKINSENPEMVLLTGDIMDGMGGSIEESIGLINNIQAKRGIYFVTGNHETYLGLDRAYSALSKTKTRILKDEVVDIDGIKLIGINYPSRGENKSIVGVLDSMEDKFEGQPNIFIYHSPVNIDQMKDSGVNLELCGHTHNGQVFPFNFITNLIYHGYDRGLHRLGDYTLYTSSGVGTWGPAVRTGNVPQIVAIKLN